MYQKIIIAGYLGKDPVMRYTPAGRAVCNFSVATNRRYTTGDGQQVDETTWFRINTWGKLAEVCNQYLSKGRKVLVEGRLNPDPDTGGPRIWTGDDGQPRASFEVTAMEVKFLDSKGASNSSGSEEDDDIPF